ncbi:hypothetical protein N1851_015504 [Merluccius polli]|uniref:Uncharacterized protein n=1 Tax=Merluccius polli TaxID=89951 RepID=A0AA47P0B1_MERPO|nr:hypothetical protein N1851_015504 [Merluccius polli]
MAFMVAAEDEMENGELPCKIERPSTCLSRAGNRGENGSSKGIKKPKKAEVNYLPPLPIGDTEATLEKERVDMLQEIKKKNNERIISEKMERSFSFRRQEVVKQCPAIQYFWERRPAEAQNHNGSLGNNSSHYAGLLHSKNAGDIQQKRWSSWDQNMTTSGFTQPVKKMKVHSDTDVSIVIEGTEVLHNCGSVAKACLLLMGIIYSMNFISPPKPKYTFEVFQKLLLELDVLKLSPKILSLQNKLIT